MGTKRPTKRPTKKPTKKPTKRPNKPSKKPSKEPTRQPTSAPTGDGTSSPTPEDFCDRCVPPDCQNDFTCLVCPGCQPTEAPTVTPPTPAPITTTLSPTAGTPETPAPVAPDTPAPVVPDTPAPVDPGPDTAAPVSAPTNSTRFLVWDGENMIVDEVGGGSGSSIDTKNVNKEVTVTVNEAPFAYETDRNICHEVDARLINNQANRDLCHTYLNLPLVTQTTDNGKESCVDAITTTKIPKVYYSVSATAEESLTHLSINAYNPTWEHHHYSDTEA